MCCVGGDNNDDDEKVIQQQIEEYQERMNEAKWTVLMILKQIIELDEQENQHRQQEKGAGGENINQGDCSSSSAAFQNLVKCIAQF